jgi:hypothetical protein
MALITFPSTPGPSSMQWRLDQPTQINTSAWTGKRQALPSGRGWWECSYNLPPIVGTAAFNPWRAFIALSRGGANEFRVPVDPTPQEPDTATPTDGSTLSLDFIVREYFSLGGTTSLDAYVSGAGQTGRSLTTGGWPSSDTVLAAGEFVTINDQLLQLTADVVSDGSGNATITFEPPIRVIPASGDSIEYRNPYALMYLTEIPVYDVSMGYAYSIQLNLREAI